MSATDAGSSPDRSSGIHGRAAGRSRYSRFLSALEHAEALDRYVDAAAPVARRLVAAERVRALLHGDATGIPLHVIVKDLPFGAWFMAQFLDLFRDPGSRQAATRLVTLGLVSSVPAAVTGWAEWVRTGRSRRRVGIVHASSNGVAVLIFLASLVARTRGHYGWGAGLGRAGGVFLVIGGFLGGHIARGRLTRPGSVPALQLPSGP